MLTGYGAPVYSGFDEQGGFGEGSGGGEEYWVWVEFQEDKRKPLNYQYTLKIVSCHLPL